VNCFPILGFNLTHDVNDRLSRMLAVLNKLFAILNRTKQVALLSQVEYTGTQVVTYATALFSLTGRLRLALDEIAESLLGLQNIQPGHADRISQLSDCLDELRHEVKSSFHEVALVVRSVKSTSFEAINKGQFSLLSCPYRAI
jgi:hypothetical protein